MTSSAAGSVASGRPYLVVEVSGEHPQDLDDFVGEVPFTAVADAHTYQVVGVGARTGEVVRFYEKDQPSGRDRRTWQISRDDDGEFLAELLSNY